MNNPYPNRKEVLLDVLRGNLDITATMHILGSDPKYIRDLEESENPVAMFLQNQLNFKLVYGELLEMGEIDKDRVFNVRSKEYQSPEKDVVGDLGLAPDGYYRYSSDKTWIKYG